MKITVDADLIRLAQQGDLEAFNHLVLGYQDSVYNLACRVLGGEAAASQAAQLAFWRAYQGLGGYRLGLWQARFWRAWLFRWVVQACRSLAGLQNPGRQSPCVVPDCVVPDCVVPDCVVPDATPPGSNGLLDLGPLPLDLRLLVALVDLEGLDYEEAALAFNASPAKVKSCLARARQQLSQQLSSQPAA